MLQADEEILDHGLNAVGVEMIVLGIEIGGSRDDDELGLFEGLGLVGRCAQVQSPGTQIRPDLRIGDRRRLTCRPMAGKCHSR